MRCASDVCDGVYIASKVRHASKWLALRAAGVPIVSTWIDEAGDYATLDWPDLWRRCITEASNAAACIVYVEPGDVLKGALLEMGAAMASGVPVFWVGPIDLAPSTHRGAYGVTHVATMEEALAGLPALGSVDARVAAEASTARGEAVTRDGHGQPWRPCLSPHQEAAIAAAERAVVEAAEARFEAEGMFHRDSIQCIKARMAENRMVNNLVALRNMHAPKERNDE